MQIVDNFIKYIRGTSGEKRAPRVDDYDSDKLQAEADRTGEKQVVFLSSGARVVFKPTKQLKAERMRNGRFSAEYW